MSLHNISIGDSPRTNVPQMLQSAGQLREMTITPTSTPATPAEEERGIAEQKIEEASLVFHRTRMQVIEALRAIAADVFDRFQIHREGGLDLGSGATGFMLGHLVEPLINRSTWAHSDVNPRAVDSIRRLHPGDRAVVGSYLNPAPMIEEGWGEGHKFPVITALSSLDATQFPALAIQRIQEMLMPGGHFVHIQDVRPGLGVNFRELNHMGHKAPFRAYGTANGDPFVFIAGLGAYSVGELFRRNIGRAVHEAAGMDLLFNRWVTATRDIEGPISRIYYLNALIQSAIHETLDMPAFEEASAVVTVARKR